MNDEVENIMRLASLLAMHRVQRFKVNQPTYRGQENNERISAVIEKVTAELRAAVEELSLQAMPTFTYVKADDAG